MMWHRVHESVRLARPLGHASVRLARLDVGMDEYVDMDACPSRALVVCVWVCESVRPAGPDVVESV